MIFQTEVDMGAIGVIPAMVWANYSSDAQELGWEVERVLCLINGNEVDIWPDMLEREQMLIIDALEADRKERL